MTVQQLRAAAALAEDQFGSQPLCQAIHNCLQLQQREIQCPLLASVATCIHIHTHSPHPIYRAQNKINLILRARNTMKPVRSHLRETKANG